MQKPAGRRLRDPDQRTGLVEQPGPTGVCGQSSVSCIAGREQDAMAQWILAELASDRAWEEALAGSQDRLSELGAEALREHRAGRSERLDPDKL